MDPACEALIGDSSGTGPSYLTTVGLLEEYIMYMTNYYGSKFRLFDVSKSARASLFLAPMFDCYERRTALKPWMLEHLGC